MLTLLIYSGILALGSFVEEPEKRSRWMAVTNTMAFLAVMFNYYAPEIFPGLHQVGSSPETVDVQLADILGNSSTITAQQSATLEATL